MPHAQIPWISTPGSARIPGRNAWDAMPASRTKGNKRGQALDAKVHAFKRGESGPVVLAGQPGQSQLLEQVAPQEEDWKMPLKGERLSADLVVKIRRWISEGAVWPENDADSAAARDPRLYHWSFQPVLTEFGGANSVDDFVAAKLKASGLAAGPEAARRTLIRRLSFNLHGRPPSWEQVGRFVRNPDLRAYERLVDEFLGSPQDGDRWARHSRDIEHFAGVHGFEWDQLLPKARLYRDYVIAALHGDKPDDQFVREQIVSEVIARGDPESVIATGFLAAGPWDFVGHVETKSDVLEAQVASGWFTSDSVEIVQTPG